MANNEPKQVVVTEQDGAVDSILTYLKERIESPFLMSFLFAWAVTNRDFMFYLFFSDESNKHQVLALWQLPWTKSFIEPLLYGTAIALLFSPISMVLSGCRYFFLSQVASFAQKNKDSFDLAHAIGVAKNQLKLLDQEVKDKKACSAAIARDIESNKKELEETEGDLVTTRLGIVAPFLIKAARFDAQYKLGEFSGKAGKYTDKIEANSVIELRIDELTYEGMSPRPTGKFKSFNGTVYDFLTSKTYFSVHDVEDLGDIKILIEQLNKKEKTICRKKSGSPIGIALLSSTTYYDS